ncbi:hypothetical protein BDA99DRAFT_514299 [Phascolomyces articulosus]|uniref:DUF4097 domain-containing protein n=1 Tax=Phascolomyces articulosus TaxID=60185 RepID=A0AAD5JX54_9FUNG|nr:hypothetical protein BDA99DRAFT_514299 [Phascolomyces articulosus]
MGFFGNFDNKKGYEALDTEDPETNAPPPPYSPAAVDRDEQTASAPSRSDLQKDYQSFEQYQQQQVLLNQQQQQNRVPDVGSPSSSSSPSPYPYPTSQSGHNKNVYPPYQDGAAQAHNTMGQHQPPFRRAPPTPTTETTSECDVCVWFQSMVDKVKNWRQDRIRLRQEEERKRRFKRCCAGFTCGALIIFVLIPILVSIIRPSIDHCVRDGSSGWDSLPEKIPFEGGAVRVDINGGISGGNIKLEPLPGGQEGYITSHVNAAPSSLIDKFQYRLNRVGPETQLILNFPDSLGPFFGCVYVEIRISIPMDASSVIVNTADMAITADEAIKSDYLELKTTNSRIKLEHGWHGNKIVLRSRNSGFDFHDDMSLHAIDSIDLETTNGGIRLDNADTVTGSIRLSSSNGRIQAKNTHAATLLDVHTSNGRIEFEDTTAPHMVVRTTNGKVELNRVTADDTLTVQTWNGAIRAIVDGSERIKATFQTSNGKIRVNMVIIFFFVTLFPVGLFSLIIYFSLSTAFLFYGSIQSHLFIHSQSSRSWK